MLPPVGTWQQHSGFLCLSFLVYERQGEGVALATAHPKLCDLEDLPASLSPSLVYTRSAVVWAQAAAGTRGTAASSSRTHHHPSLGAPGVCCFLQPALTVRDPNPPHAGMLPSSAHTGKVPKTPHPGLGHEPSGSHPLTWGLHVPHSQQHPSREDPSWPAAPTTPALVVGFADPTARPISQGVGPGPLVHVV